MTQAMPLRVFAYGEQREGTPLRSLGFRLLVPVEPEPWSVEVEGLARQLQAAPYPDSWPPTDLFCSVLLADGRRLVALARYGLADHTLGHRRGGLELIGVVGPGNLDVSSALSIYHWLKQRRQDTDNLRALSGDVLLTDALEAVPPEPLPRDSMPVLPIRLWHEGVLLFAAVAPEEPDRCLGLLEQATNQSWQWLPLVGGDFPLQTYGQRGPLLAWTPTVAGAAVKPVGTTPERLQPAMSRSLVGLACLGIAVLLLLGVNLWAALDARKQVQEALAAGRSQPVGPSSPAAASEHERFAQALYRLLQQEGIQRDWTPEQLTAQYERLTAIDPDLRVATPEGQLAVGSVSLLARRGPTQIEQTIREALANRGYDPRLIELACQRVHERLTSDPQSP